VAQMKELEGKRAANEQLLENLEKEISSRRKEAVAKLKVLLSWLSKP
jgi:uncharacterized coiled-coil protein SlyX